MGTFARAQIKRIMRKAGAEMISREAVERIDQLMEDRALELTALALEIARHAGRATLRDEDFVLLEKIRRTLK